MHLAKENPRISLIKSSSYNPLNLYLHCPNSLDSTVSTIAIKDTYIKPCQSCSCVRVLVSVIEFWSMEANVTAALAVTYTIGLYTVHLSNNLVQQCRDPFNGCPPRLADAYMQDPIKIRPLPTRRSQMSSRCRYLLWGTYVSQCTNCPQ